MTTPCLFNHRPRTEAQALADRLRARIQTMHRAGAIEREIAAELLALIDGYQMPARSSAS